MNGNTTALLQVKTTTKDKIGAAVTSWVTVAELQGFLDYQSGDASIGSFKAKIQETTHLFICDFKPIPKEIVIEGKSYKVNDESTRMVADSQEYNVLHIDDPMNLHKHLEIYLKYTGGQ